MDIQTGSLGRWHFTFLLPMHQGSVQKGGSSDRNYIRLKSLNGSDVTKRAIVEVYSIFLDIIIF